ncbi:MAG TPA: DivIVA domain-containing protein [Pilimelia sp.]|nr:DivIVA domain-containing protein [Pilimelia sp.]
MGQFLLLLVVALTVAAVVFGVTALVSGTDNGLSVAEPDGRAVPLPGTRPLVESDVTTVRFDTALRGYRMAQVDQALRRAAYDIGYKDELISVLEAEVTALREGRTSDAEVLRRAREAAIAPQPAATVSPDRPAEPAIPAGGMAPAGGAAAPAEAAASAAADDPAALDERAGPAERTEPAENTEPAESTEQAATEQRAEPAEPAEPAESTERR